MCLPRLQLYAVHVGDKGKGRGEKGDYKGERKGGEKGDDKGEGKGHHQAEKVQVLPDSTEDLGREYQGEVQSFGRSYGVIKNDELFSIHRIC